jgi:hypothetical protein
MSSSSDILTGPELKVKRAHRHIEELRRMTDPLDRGLYEIKISKVRPTVIHLNPTKYDLTYRPKEKIPETLALIIGDAISNLRAALDHLANGILRRWHPDPPPKPYFPVHPERKQVVTDKFLAAIEEALPGSKELFLEKIRPNGGPNDHIWKFGKLNQIDKHSLIIPTVTLIRIRDINIRSNGLAAECVISGDAACPQRIFRSDAPFTIRDNFQTSVHVQFGQGTSFKDEPVIPTLTQISDVVSKTIDAFGAHINAVRP